MLKRALAGVSALAILGCGAASAADLATRYPVKAVVPVVPVFSWTGFYIGGNVGYAWANNSYDYTSPLGFTTSYDVGGGDGWVAGLQAGYNYQFANNVVLGIEADIDWTGVGGSNGIFTGPLVGTNSVAGGELDYFGTIRARVGYAFDRWLPYVTGGAAWGKIDNGTFYGFDNSSTNWGWTIGAGVEYAITNNLTAKLEYLYVDLDGNTLTNPFNLSTVSTSFDMSVVKAGVNWKF
ncbi:membrane protein [Azorhizobium oxalatiphilum]|uniref:Membrane protein n=1 Tax=Azorhizobium oxalatiphilum TaxID=980631 RepID=A0A917CGM2_9HYPH|nr:outer membrane protein [Azorhizobium oxalatiphilum]GGF88459.1 membrane protein [Azorhizobium oxalatiphilum]